MTKPHLVDVWRQILASKQPGLHLADAQHPLQIFVGANDDAIPRLVIRSALKPAKLSLSDIVLVERHQDEAGKWNLALTLQDRKFEEVFLRLADDIHARSADSPNEATALHRVSAVIDEWRRLLRTRNSARLSMDELRGLVGELWALHNVFSQGRSPEAAVQGWLGPMGLPQDFWFAEDGLHEVKAIGPATTHVRISSENQLDASEIDLVVLRVANTGEGTPRAVSLHTAVASVHAALFGTSVNPHAFDDRLARLGVDLTDAFYQDTWFIVGRLTRYSVTPAFPAIRASDLAPGISRVTYQLALVDIASFVCSDLEVT